MSKYYKKITFLIFLVTSITYGVNVYSDSKSGRYSVAQFSDISNHWAKDIISKYASKGFVKGMSDGTFRPDEKITRAQFFRMLHTGMGIDNKYFVKPDVAKIYKDVKNDDWYAMTIYDLYTEGIIDDKEYIRGNEYITREEMAHYLIKAYWKSGMSINDLMPLIKDKENISKKYLNDVYYSYNAKILAGKTAGFFEPKSHATRAEGLVAVDNLLKVIEYNNNGTKIYDINENGDPLVREENKKIEVKVEGQSEMRNAKLTFSEGLGYSFYLLDNFGYSPEEPGKDIIFSKYDGEFFVRIEKLSKNTDIQGNKEAFKKEYSSMGLVNDIDPKTIFAEKFKDSKIYIHVDIPKSESIKTQTSVNYIVKEFGGDLYAFTFHFPLKEAAEGITPSFWAMVSTISNTVEKSSGSSIAETEDKNNEFASQKMGIRMNFPESWIGKYIVQEINDSVEILHKSKLEEQSKPEKLFTIVKHDSKLDYEKVKTEMENSMPYRVATEIDGKVYAYYIRTDIAYVDAKTMEEFISMEKDIDTVIKSIKKY